ncbi:hypothetical protein [Nonomuraea sp. NPDC049480]|uniref:hypothetical protein n=1 Tax=Nonomuraea sp. NPDC049480 TaxID=3364353 RepID=UPI00378C5E79
MFGGCYGNPNEGDDRTPPGGPYVDWRRHIAEVTADVVPADVEELLNTVGQRVGESLILHRPISATELYTRAIPTIYRSAVSSAS